LKSPGSPELRKLAAQQEVVTNVLGLLYETRSIKQASSSIEAINVSAQL
jgi:hypothetical protein